MDNIFMFTAGHKRFGLFITLIAGIILMVATGSQNLLVSKKYLTEKADGCELVDGLADETDSSPDIIGFLPAHEFSYSYREAAISDANVHHTVNSHKQLHESRLYILFHQLKTRTA